MPPTSRATCWRSPTPGTRRGSAGESRKSTFSTSIRTNPRATIVADVTNLDGVESETFDCIVLTQVLQLVYDVRSAMRALARVLAPGGVLLATLPGRDAQRARQAGVLALHGALRKGNWPRRRSAATPEVATYGNVLAATASSTVSARTTSMRTRSTCRIRRTKSPCASARSRLASRSEFPPAGAHRDRRAPPRRRRVVPRCDDLSCDPSRLIRQGDHCFRRGPGVRAAGFRVGLASRVRDGGRGGA